MEYFNYIRRKALATVIRYGAAREAGTLKTHQDEVLQIPSRDTGRTIKVHLYRSRAAKPTPILVNFHGSGFVIPLHGSDDEFACRVVKDTDYAVLDVSYRLAPEYPHPAAVNDVEDTIKWVLTQGAEFDLSKLAISGFSAGGNLALVAASTLFPQQTFALLVAIYPPTAIDVDPKLKVAPDTSGRPLPDWLTNAFNDMYTPSPTDRRGATVSPAYTDGEAFPDRLVVITCACDSLCDEAETFAEKVKAVPGKHVVLRRMEGCDHGWDKSCKSGTPQEKAKDEAYDLVVDELRNAPALK